MAMEPVTDQPNTIGLPEEIVGNILFQSSTPTFLQLTRTSKEFYNCANHNRKLLLHHLNQIPGPKENIDNKCRDNSALFQLLRQRAINSLYGINFTANVTEYIARHTKLNLGASCISGLDADYVRHALCFENSVDIRQYTSNCLVKEKINQHPNTKILKTVQWERYLSMLCAYPNAEEEAEDFPEEEESDYYDSDSESDSEPEREVEDVEKASFAPSVNALLESRIKLKISSRASSKRKPPPKVKSCKYRICHYDIYTLEDSATFVIDDQPGLVPRDFIVQNRHFCAVLWDKDTVSGRPTLSAKIIVYVARETQMYYAPKYDEQTIWPKKSKPSRIPANHSDDEEESVEYPPEKIAFFRDGRRIKMYNAGGIVPYKVFSSFAADDERSYTSSNVVHYGGLESIDFYVDTPFYGMHGKYYDDHAQQDYCYQTYLCLGTSMLSFGEQDGDTREANVLCILRSQTKMDPEDCDHKVSLQRMAHLSAQSSSIVARLWGWEEMHTNMTGKEAVAVSSGGTRIAIAMWDKVLIYAINPKVLCEETVVDSTDDENEKSKKKKRRSKKTWEYPATQYYHRIKDDNLLDMNVAQLKPVVIDLNGAIAHRMHWSPAKGKITDTATVVDEEPIAEPQVEENVNQSDENSSESSSSDAESDTVGPEPGADMQLLQPQISGPDGVEDSTSILNNTAQTTIDAKSVDIEQHESLVSAEGQKMINLGDTSSMSGQENADTRTETQAPTIDEACNLALPNVSSHDTSNAAIPSLTLPEINTPTMSPPPSTAVSVAASTNQASKPSARKKEKSPEVSHENMNPAAFAKDKYVSGYAVVEQHKQKNGLTVSTPSSPIMSKICPKPKQTVAEALAINNTPLPPSPGILEADAKLPSALPSIGQQVEDTSQTKLAAIVDANNDSSSIGIQSSIEQADHSKSAANMELAQRESSHSESLKVEPLHAEQSLPQSEIRQEVEQGAEKDKEAHPKRKKRVTEDELIILTDRGIQIWNLGPRAKGLRPRPRGLPMEEGLAGRIPLLKQSQSDWKKAEKKDSDEV